MLISTSVLCVCCAVLPSKLIYIGGMHMALVHCAMNQCGPKSNIFRA